jgi:RimJ/RimL family protein N-acetyltransferase
MSLIETETARLRLRQWRADDLAPFAELNADPAVMEFLGAALPRDESDALADRFRSLIDRRGWGFWAAETKTDGRFIGYIGLHVPSAAVPFAPCVEVGWRLARNYWGRGLASEGAAAALEIAFEVLGLAEIVSFTTVANRRSRAVMERIGMIEQPATFEHPSLPPDSPLRKHCLYRLPRTRWATRRNQPAPPGAIEGARP